MNKFVTSALIAAGLVSATPLVLAQATADAPQSRQMQRHEHAQRAFSLPSERVEARLAYLKTALKITDAQRPQWDAFADVARKQAQDADQRVAQRRGQREEGARPSAIQRLEMRQVRLNAQSQRLGEILTAAKPLYAVLSPEQKQIADGLLAARGQHGRFGHGHMHGHA